MSATKNHLQTFHPLAESQWGFLPGKSTVLGLLATTHNWLSILESGGEIGAVFFDLRKAFDSIPHEVLLEKLEKIGLCNPILAWISDYLTCREQKVVVNGAESQHTTVLSGVPQGLASSPGPSPPRRGASGGRGLGEGPWGGGAWGRGYAGVSFGPITLFNTY